MSILELGINAIAEEIDDRISAFPAVVAAEKEMKTALDNAHALMCKDNLDAIENALVNMIAAYQSSGFRVGVTEGVKLLANEIQPIFDGNGVGNK